MTVKELKELLENFEDNDEIKFGYDSGNRWNHIIADEIHDFAYMKVAYSDYNRAERVYDEWNDDIPENLETRDIVVIM